MKKGSESISVEVVYALAATQQVISLQLAPGTTAGEAVEASGFKIGGPRIGIGGRPVAAGYVLRDGDRVELLRPLAMDPKEARRSRARKARRR